jgi:hypothetical protein
LLSIEAVDGALNVEQRVDALYRRERDRRDRRASFPRLALAAMSASSRTAAWNTPSIAPVRPVPEVATDS